MGYIEVTKGQYLWCHCLSVLWSLITSITASLCNQFFFFLGPIAIFRVIVKPSIGFYSVLSLINDQLLVLLMVCNHVTDFNARNKSLTAKLLQQGYRYHKLRKTFSKFYRRHYELISKYNVGLKTLLSEGLSEPEFYGDLVYKFKKLIGSNDFSFQFRKIITRYRRIGYNLNVMRQSACLVFNPITVDNYAAFFNCTPVGRASDSMMAPT